MQMLGRYLMVAAIAGGITAAGLPWVQNAWKSFQISRKDAQIEVLTSGKTELTNAVRTQNRSIQALETSARDRGLAAERAVVAQRQAGQARLRQIRQAPITPEGLNRFFAELGQ